MITSSSSVALTAAILGAVASTHAAVLGGVDLGNLPHYLFVFTDGSAGANWQSPSSGYVGDVAINGLSAAQTNTGTFPYAGTISTNAATLGAWQSVVTANASQANAALGQSALVQGLSRDLASAFTQINALPATTGYAAVNATNLNGLNTQNGVNETLIINVTSGFTDIKSPINITGDAGDTFILRWDSDPATAGYQGRVRFRVGGGINPLGGLTPRNFLNVAGDMDAQAGGSNPSGLIPYLNQIASIDGGSAVSGGGFFTGYWLTTGDPVTHITSSFSHATFLGGWYTSSARFNMTSGTSGISLHLPEPTSLFALGSFAALLLRRRRLSPVS